MCQQNIPWYSQILQRLLTRREKRIQRTTEIKRLLAKTEAGTLLWRREHEFMYTARDGSWSVDVDITEGRILVSDDEVVLAHDLTGPSSTQLLHAIVRSAHPGITERDILRIV